MPRAVSEPAIEVKGLVKRYEDVTAVDGIDLRIAAGECVGLLGPNGAGKTTTLEILEGLLAPTDGWVRVLGRAWSDGGREIRSRIGVQLQETQLYGRSTVEETLGLFRSLFPRGLTVDETIALVNLQDKRSAQVKTLSGGQRQRLALAVALVADPELLFLDEPTTGLDPRSRRELWDVIETLKGRGRTVVLTTHYMEEAERLCDRVIIVDHGKVIAEGTPASLIAKLAGPQVIELSAHPGLAAETLRARVPGLVELREHDGLMRLSVQELHQALPAILASANQEGSTLSHLTTRQATLDDVFLSLTGHRLREAESAR
jgi:ABC-2 type transport system ATP-binding protein